MMRAGILMLIALATALGSSGFSSAAEAHGWRHRGFVKIVPVYPVVYSGYCRWLRTPYGLVKRCYY